MKKKISLSFILFVCFVLSIIYALFSIHYKIKHYGFSINPNSKVDVWLVEAKILYETIGGPVNISISVPNDKFILADTFTADEYTFEETNIENKKNVHFFKENAEAGKKEKIYYRILLLDNKNSNYPCIDDSAKEDVDKPYFNDSQLESAKKIIELAKNNTNNNDFITNLILMLNNKSNVPEIQTFLPLKTDTKDMFNVMKSFLALENIPVRMIRGVNLIEGKTFQRPDLLLEVYYNNEWRVYNLENGSVGMPNNFIVFQHGGNSLLDVEGGKDSKILFSVLKNKYNTLFLSKYKAELNSKEEFFKYSMYSLPIREQNILKIIATFPLAILVIVILRNMVGIKTLGTFTPILIAMSFIETGLIRGLVAFIFLISIGLFIRKLFSKMNLLLVPRISSVVILVIFLIQVLTVLSYNLNIRIGLSLLFFPLIITAWIIERSTILMEESGEKEALNQNIHTLLVASLTYLVISSEQIRYIMYVFNELNVCILFLVMLIGTYTGYRLTELTRFKTLIKKND